MSVYLLSPKTHIVDLMSKGSHRLTEFMLCCGIDKFTFNQDYSDIIRKCDVSLYREGELKVTIYCQSSPMENNLQRSQIRIKNEVTGACDMLIYRVLPPLRPIRRVHYYILPDEHDRFGRHYQSITGHHPHLFI